MKKLSVILLIFVMLLNVSCGNSSASPLEGLVASENRESEGMGDTISTTASGSVGILNDSGYTFVELYSTPSSSTDFGSELMGGARVESGESLTLNIDNILEPQDLWIVDNDGDSYSFIGLELMDAATMSLTLTNDGNVVIPQLYILDSSGNEIATVDGLFIQNSDTNATGYDSSGYYYLTVNNNSSYDIYSIHVGIANASSAYDVDILPEILPGQSSIDITGFATQGDWLTTEWTLYITDVEGDTSASFDTFNPWTVSSIDVQWDNNAGGYVVAFNY